MWQVLTSFDPAVLLTFVAAGLVLNLTPGVDFIYVMTSGIAGGMKRGAAAAFGINLGILVHVLMAAGGISALLIAYPAAYQVIKYAGAAWLLWLAIKAWRDTAEPDETAAQPTMGRAVMRGFLTNVLNPKTALFIFAFIPQFTDPANGAIGLQILFLGLIFMANGFLFSLLLGASAGWLGERLRAGQGLMNKITAIVFGGLAARLVLD